MKDFTFNNSVLVKTEDLNPSGNLYGGRLLEWIDEKAALFTYCQLNYSSVIVTKFISEINFVSSAKNGDIVEFGFRTVSVGNTSITIECVVRNKTNNNVIIKIDKIVFVHMDKDKMIPKPHGYTIENIGNQNNK